MYLTLALDDDKAKAEQRLDAYLAGYYGQRPDAMRKRQRCYGGPAGGAAEWLAGYARAGVDHMVLRFAGEHERQLDAVAELRRRLNW
jgi:hypothetical protein